jgi:chemotaxis protein MotB
MENRSSHEILKEELRIKNRELKRLQAEKEKFDLKLRHIAELTEKTVTDLREQLTAKNQALQERSKALRSLEAQGGGAASPSAESGGATPLDPKITEAIIALRKRNSELERKIHEGSAAKSQLLLERDSLISEMKRMRDQPEALNALKVKIQKMEKEYSGVMSQYQLNIKEKDDIIKSYETVMKEKFKCGSKDPAQFLSELHAEMEMVKSERDELKKRADREKDKFKERLAEEIKKIEAEWEAELKKARAKSRENIKHSVEEIHEEGVGLWVLTFSDMITQLTTFFILLYVLSAKNVVKFKEAILGEESASIGVLELLDTMEIKQKLGDMAGIKSKTKDARDELRELVNQKALPADVSVGNDHSKIVVRMPGGTLFQPGKADLQPLGRPAIDEVINVVMKFPEYRVNIQGHTDDLAIASPQFPTNWELSAARATAVLRYFIDKGIKPEKLTATGFADIFPIASNSTELGRSKNRRVEIVLEKEKKS